MHIVHIVGARPNFMKAAPVIATLADHEGIEQSLVHTGQHYDANMSDIFFQQLGLPEPEANLNVGSGSHAIQTAQIMIRCEEFLLARRPDIVLVYGDVNSTVAAALVCAKLLIRVGHVEAGLRSFDRTMPEEINRLLTDQMADVLFTPSEDGNTNLAHEGIASDKIYLVGNVMVDTLVRLLPLAPENIQRTRFGIEGAYGLVTLHRPSNVDHPTLLEHIFAALVEISQSIPIIFPVHPRTRQYLKTCSEQHRKSNIHLVEPLGYLDFLALQRQAMLVITDSGGIQEETTFLGIPCLTVRKNTERPVTVTIGTNVLVGQDMEHLKGAVDSILSGRPKTGAIPPLWDGKASERIAEVLVRLG